MRALILGCGYVGLPLGVELLRRGAEVFATTRTPAAQPALEAAGLRPLLADLTRPETLSALPGPFDWVVNAVAAAPDVASYRQVHLDGTRHVLAWLAAAPPRRYVALSRTSVYGQADGSAVKESHPTTPANPLAQVLAEAERELLAAAREGKFPAVILRVAGIYGPGRGEHFQRFLRGAARIPSPGTRCLNMVHRDDVVGAILTALKNGQPGEVYNVVDDEPVALLPFYRWLSETLGRDMPTPGPDDPEETRPPGFAQHKVQNRRLKMELGYTFKYPNFRHGYSAEIRRLDQAGEL